MSGRRRRRLFPWAAILAAVAATAATGGTTIPAGAARRTASAASDGTTMVVDVPSVPTNLNPHTVAGDTAETLAVGDAIWPQCYQVAPGLAVDVDSFLLASAEVVSVDPQTVVYHIDPKAVWSDGVPIRADDFVYLWHRETAADGTPPASSGSAPTGSEAPAASGAGPSGAAVEADVASDLGYRDIASVTGSTDGTVVTVVFRAPYADWPALFDDLLPSQVATAAGWSTAFDGSQPSDLVSGGPWQVTAWTPGQRLELSPNPRWWGPKPTLGHIVLQASGSTTAMVDDLVAGRAQAIQPDAFDLATLDAVSSVPTVRSSAAIGTTMLQLVFNTRQAPLDQVAVRQALAHLVDRAQLVSRLVQPLQPLTWVDGSFLYPNVQGGYVDDGAGYLNADPVTASRLLATAGIVPDSLGRQTLGGTPLDLSLTWAADDPWSALAGPVVAADLEAAGIAVDSQPAPAASLAGSLSPGGTWDMALAAVPGQAFLSQLAPAYSTAFGTMGVDGIEDWSGYDDPAVDALLAQASSELAADQQQVLYRQVDTDLWAAMPALPLFAEPSVSAWSSSISGIDPDEGGAGLLWGAQNLTTTASATRALRRGGADQVPR